MDKEQILRDEFPTTRKGWDPDAVRLHLQAVAESMSGASETGATPDGPKVSLADLAAERVRVVIDAAEQAADGIETEARTEASKLVGDARAESDGMLSSARSESDGMLSSARSESDGMLSSARSESEGLLSSARTESTQTLNAARAEAERMTTAARDEASMRVGQARSAVEGLISQADELRDRVGVLGEELAGSIRSSAASVAEFTGPAVVPEPAPPLTPEPTPYPIPEPTPEPVPEPTPDPVPEPTPEPEPEPTPPPVIEEPVEPVVDEPPVPEPSPVPVADAGSASTDDLIAQLRGDSPGGDAEESAGPPVSNSDLGAARLVAMNMALEGVSREQISVQLEAEFGVVPDQDGLLDEVFARAGR